ncbi:MAG TPA: hypothetical protein VGH44_01005 [Candidatus Saccharimonadia bacterium]|jgi:hypothetical protein
MPEHPEVSPHESGRIESADHLSRMLQESSAETQRSAANLLADTLRSSLQEHEAVIRRALGPEAYAEVESYTHARFAVDRALTDELEVEEAAALEGGLDDQPYSAPSEENPGEPEAMIEYDDVKNWVDNEIFEALDPYRLASGRLWSQPRRISDQGEKKITISRFMPSTNAGVIFKVTATGPDKPGSLRELKRSLLSREAASGASPLTPGEAFDLETKLKNYHAKMTEIAALTPEQIMEYAHPHDDGPDDETV